MSLIPEDIVNPNYHEVPEGYTEEEDYSDEDFSL